MKNKTFSCIIFENGFTILSFDGKTVGRTREIPSFRRTISLTIVVLLDGVCHVGGGSGGVCGRHGCSGGGIGWWCLWWCRYSWCLFVCWHWLVMFVVVVGGVSVFVVFVMYFLKSMHTSTVM